MKLAKTFLALNALMASGIALAGAPGGPPGAIPEPGVLSLLAAGGVVGAIIAFRNRRK